MQEYDIGAYVYIYANACDYGTCENGMLAIINRFYKEHNVYKVECQNTCSYVWVYAMQLRHANILKPATTV